MTELLTIDEAAQLLRLPVATLRHYRATGKGGPRSAKIGAKGDVSRQRLPSIC
jgi:hypothetical protein